MGVYGSTNPIFSSNPLHRSLFPGVPEPVGSYAGPVGSFDASRQFVPSPETERLIQYLEGREGKKINVKPFDQAPGGDQLPSSAYGVFFGEAPQGGSADPTSRTVYLNPEQEGTNLAVLAHELGHAFDPNLPKEYAAYGASEPERIKALQEGTAQRNPVGFLNTYMLGPEVKVRLETEAQRAATENLKGIGYPTSQFTNDAWYKGYPGSFVTTGLDQAAALYSLPQNVPQGVPTEMMDFNRGRMFRSMGGGDAGTVVRRPALGPNDPEIDFSDEVARNLLNLGLSKKYNAAEEAARNRSKEYIETRLGGY